jgi:AraC-like DNA-binding protein
LKINILYSFIIAAIFQGLLLSCFILFSKKYNQKAAKYLGLLLLMVSLSQLQYLLEDLELISWHIFNLIYLPFGFLETPFLYFFIKFYLYPKEKTKKVEWLLFIPAVFFLISTLSYKIIYFITGQTWETNEFLNKSSDLIDSHGDYIIIILLTIVLCIQLIRIRNYERLTSLYNNQQIRLEFAWLKILLLCILLVIIPWIYYTYRYMLDEDVTYMPMDLIVSIIIYIVGYIGMHKLNILSERKKIRLSIIKSSKSSSINKSKNEHIAHLEKIVIQNQGYLNPNLTLDSLTEELQLSKSHLSRIINAELNTSFTDYINSLRVSEAKKLLLNSDFSNYTLIAIGLESGFNSKTTFNTVFKKLTNQTPSQFRKDHTN